MLGWESAVQDTQSVTPPCLLASSSSRRELSLVLLGLVLKNNDYDAISLIGALLMNNRIVVTATIPTEATLQETASYTKTEIKESLHHFFFATAFIAFRQPPKTSLANKA